MRALCKPSWRACCSATLLAVMPALAPLADALAQDGAPNTQEMVEALKPRTRSLRNLIVTPGVNTDANAAVNAGENAAVNPGAPSAAASAPPAAATPVPEPAAARPSLSMAVRFDFDSTRLRPEGTAVLDRLAAALQNEALQGSRFLIEGHTDATGGAAYNLRLSQGRADEVRRYLTAHGLAPQRLSAVGKGAHELANPAEPGAAENRRVRIVNLD